MKQTPNAERSTSNAECRRLGLKFDVRCSVFDVRSFVTAIAADDYEHEHEQMNKTYAPD
jgi:hypothetical protein